MLNFCSLYSGSTGNSLYIESENTKILIDAGVSAKKIVTALEQIGTNIDSIDAILVTHEHIDHIQSIGTLSKKFNIPVFSNLETWKAMPTQLAKITEENRKTFNICESFDIKDLHITAFPIPHDAANPCGFNIFKDNNKISIATDLGHITKPVMSALENSSFVMLESNYDTEVLKCCNYPYKLKTRIAGPNGHLSNSLAGKTIAYLMNKGLKQVMLGHLSKENNFPELAYKTVMEEITCKNADINIHVASRIEPSNLLKIC